MLTFRFLLLVLPILRMPMDALSSMCSSHQIIRICLCLLIWKQLAAILCVSIQIYIMMAKCVYPYLTLGTVDRRRNGMRRLPASYRCLYLYNHWYSYPSRISMNQASSVVVEPQVVRTHLASITAISIRPVYAGLCWSRYVILVHVLRM